MKTKKRALLGAALAAVVATAATIPLALAQSAAPAGQGQEWTPARTIKIVVPIVGSTNDVLARLVAPKLQAAYGVSVIVENRPGAGGNIGADAVAKSPPDGLTLLVGYNGPLAINATLFDKLPYDPVRDFAPITLAVTSPQYLVVNAAVPVNTVAELTALARAKPDTLGYASVAVGSASHLTMEMYKSAAKVGLTHIPYKGAAPAVTDLVAGHVQAAFMVPGNVQQFARDGKLRLLASTGTRRFASTPNVPTMIESGFPEFVATSWIGFLAPAGTPKAIIERHHREITKALASPDVRDKLRELEFDIVASTPEQFSAWIRSEIPRWGAVIKATGTKVE